jgi:hypothetical protein
MVFRAGKDAFPPSNDIPLARDARGIAVGESTGIPVNVRKQLARLLIGENTNRLPDAVEKGLIQVFSTSQVQGPHITIGAPVPPGERDLDWALMHLLITSPDYFGRTRVLIQNLEQASDPNPAYRNAYQKSAADINKEAEAHLRSGAFGTSTISGRPINPNKDINPTSLSMDDARLAVADLYLSAGSPRAEGAYISLHGPAAAEGLGLLAIRDHKTDEAQRLFASAVESNTKSARAWLELGALEQDTEKARKDLEKAAQLNPRWAAPQVRLSLLETDPAKKAVFLKKATVIEPRNIDYWKALAKADIDAQNFADAEKAWAGAVLAGANPEERAQLEETRRKVDQERMDFELAEKKRQREERERDIERVKAQSEAAIHAAEEAANKKLNPDGAPLPKAVDWDDLDKSVSVDGVLQRVQCIASRAHLFVADSDGKVLELLVANPTKVAIIGDRQLFLTCGIQKPARPATIFYTPRVDVKLHTAGDVLSIEFH